MDPLRISRRVTTGLLAIMDQKNHLSYPALTRPGLDREQLLVHFRHEYLVYVRDFPVLIARVLAQVPDVQDVRFKLAENIYEEQTGGVSKTAPHPELFLRMMEGLGFSREAFADDDAWLHPAALEYRDFLRTRSGIEPWQAACALLTIFVEGSVHERLELTGVRVRQESEKDVHEHPLVKHYGCPPEAMELRRAHARVEGDHREDAWNTVLEHVGDEGPVFDEVLIRCSTALRLWQAYRTGVAERMKLTCQDDEWLEDLI